MHLSNGREAAKSFLKSQKHAQFTSDLDSTDQRFASNSDLTFTHKSIGVLLAEELKQIEPPCII